MKYFLLVLKMLMFVFLIIASVHVRRICGYEVSLSNNYELCVCDSYAGVAKKNGLVIIKLNSGDRIGFNQNYIFGKTTFDYKTHKNSTPKDYKYTNNFFALSVKNNQLYTSGNIAELSKMCEIDIKTFEDTYRISYFYHYKKIFGIY